MARQKGDAGNWGRPVAGGGSGLDVVKAAAPAGVGQGRMYRGSRVIPAEGRALTSGALSTTVRTG
jgi:hypothetical protein